MLGGPYGLSLLPQWTQFQLSFFLSWVLKTQLHHLVPKTLSQTVTHLRMVVDPLGKNSSQCLRAGMHPRANKSPQSSLPNYHET